MPVGTHGTVKALRNEDIEELDYNLILGNAYHLYLRPGTEVIKHSGGLHRFMSWKHNILTDSGGFQVFSLTRFRKIKNDGIYFRSHIDGSEHLLTPEKVVQIQSDFGSDILMPLDVCTPSDCSIKDAENALRITTEWAERSHNVWKKSETYKKSYLFGIIQGNFFKELRKRSVSEVCSIDLPGYAIGGLSVGESPLLFKEMLAYTSLLMPEEKPRYLMGVGTPDYILDAVENGMDLFDSVFPTRISRNAMVFTPRGTLSLRRENIKMDLQPIDPECRCYTCMHYSKAYIRHLFKAREINASVLTTYHNLYFMNQLMKNIRYSIENGKFKEFKKEFLKKYMQNQN